MKLPVYLYGRPELREVSKDITADYPDLKQLIDNMWETMYDSDGIGIAAPQVGQNIRLLCIDVDCLKEHYPELAGVKFTMINAHLTVDEESPTETIEEGCLSLPGIHEKVTRHTRIHVSWVDENFEPHEQEFHGYLARVIQHEYDHLEGTMFIDHISPIRKQLIRSKLNNILKGKVNCSYRTRGVKPSR